MARVPVARGNTVELAPRPVGAVQAVSNPVGEAIGRGLMQFGAGLQDHATFLGDIANKRAEVEAKDADIEFATTLQDRLDNPETGFRRKQGRTALDAYEETVTGVKSARTEIAGKLSPLARKMFDRAAGERMLTFQRQADGHMGVEYDRAQDHTAASRIAIASSDASNSYGNLEIADANIETIKSEVREMAPRKGWVDKADIDAEILARVSPVRLDIAKRIIPISADLGERYVKQYGPEMTGDDQAAADVAIRQQRTAIAAEQRRVEREAKEEQRRQTADLAEDARDVISTIDGGASVPPESAERLAKKLEDSGKPVLALKLRTSVAVQGITTEARAWRPDQLQGWINNERSRLGTKGTVIEHARVDAAEKLLGEMKTGLANDPLSWAVKAGGTRLEPVDLANPRSVQARIRAGLGVAEKYGRSPVFLTDEESSVIAGRIVAANPETKLSIASAIAQNFGRHGRDVLGTLSKADPIFAHAAALGTMGPAGRETALRIFTGQQALRDKATSLPSSDKFDNASYSVGRAMAFTSRARGSTIEAAKAIYAADALGRGIKPDHVDNELWNKALNRAAGATYGPNGQRVGGFATYRGLQLVLPPSVAPSEFGSIIGKVQDRDLKALGAVYSNGKPMTASELQGAYLFDAGSGRYFVSLDKAGTQFVRNKQGGHFSLDIGGNLARLRGR